MQPLRGQQQGPYAYRTWAQLLLPLLLVLPGLPTAVLAAQCKDETLGHAIPAFPNKLQPTGNTCVRLVIAGGDAASVMGNHIAREYMITPGAVEMSINGCPENGTHALSLVTQYLWYNGVVWSPSSVDGTWTCDSGPAKTGFPKKVDGNWMVMHGMTADNSVPLAGTRLAATDVQCRNACQDNPDCVAYSLDGNKTCTMYKQRPQFSHISPACAACQVGLSAVRRQYPFTVSLQVTGLAASTTCAAIKTLQSKLEDVLKTQDVAVQCAATTAGNEQQGERPPEGQRLPQRQLRQQPGGSQPTASLLLTVSGTADDPNSGAKMLGIVRNLLKESKVIEVPTNSPSPAPSSPVGVVPPFISPTPSPSPTFNITIPSPSPAGQVRSMYHLTLGPEPAQYMSNNVSARNAFDTQLNDQAYQRFQLNVSVAWPDGLTGESPLPASPSMSASLGRRPLQADNTTNPPGQNMTVILTATGRANTITMALFDKELNGMVRSVLSNILPIQLNATDTEVVNVGNITSPEPPSPSPSPSPTPTPTPSPTPSPGEPSPSPIGEVDTPTPSPEASSSPSPDVPEASPSPEMITAGPPSDTPSTSSSASSSEEASSAGVIAGAVIGAVGGVALAALVALLVVRSRRAHFDVAPPCAPGGCLIPGAVTGGPQGDKVVRVVHICPNIDPPSGFPPNAAGYASCRFEGCKAPKSLLASAELTPLQPRYSGTEIDRVLSEAAEKLVAHQENSSKPQFISLAGLGGAKPTPYKKGAGMTLKRLFSFAACAPPEPPPDYQGQVSWVGQDDIAHHTGLDPQDPFMKTAAAKYSWSLDPLSGCVSVEAPVARVLAHDSHMDPKPVRLTAKEVAAQLQLMANGIIYEGPHSLVLKCRWPARFGPHALLAVKVLREPRGFDAADLRAAYKQEAQVLASCRHPSVVRLYGYCLDAPNICLVMELLPQTLEQRLHGARHDHDHTSLCGNETAIGTVYSSPDEGGDPPSKHITVPPTPPPPPMTLAEVVQVSTDIAAGLAQLHARVEPRSRRTSLEVLKEEESGEGGEGAGANAQAAAAKLEEAPSGALVPQTSDLEAGHTDQDGVTLLMMGGEGEGAAGAMGGPQRNMRIVHYDLQPCNILLTSSGRAKITGFGFKAKQAVETEGVVECITYRPPEMLTGFNTTRAKDKIDVYSLAMIMWEMAAHKRPCAGCSNDDITRKVCSGERPPLPGGPTPWKQTSSSSGASAGVPTPPASPTKKQQPGASDGKGGIWDKPMGQAGLPGSPAGEAPALLADQQQLTSLMRQCWLPQPARRPTAAAVLKTLLQLQMKLDVPQPPSRLNTPTYGRTAKGTPTAVPGGGDAAAALPAVATGTPTANSHTPDYAAASRQTHS